jgi:hypothetical protein
MWNPNIFYDCILECTSGVVKNILQYFLSAIPSHPTTIVKYVYHSYRHIYTKGNASDLQHCYATTVQGKMAATVKYSTSTV